MRGFGAKVVMRNSQKFVQAPLAQTARSEHERRMKSEAHTLVYVDIM